MLFRSILTTPGEPTRNGQYSLLAPMFVKRNGYLCCDQEQAIVPVKPGDIVVHLTGSLPAEDNNPEAFINGEMITAIDPESNTAMTDPYPLTFEDVPVLVIRGTEKYHNRDGRFFCDAESAEGDNHE